MRILFFGAGGVGSLFGGFLARMGHDVSLLGRASHMDAIAKQGLSITGIWGDYRIKAFNLFTDAGEIKKKNISFDVIFLTVKSYDTAAAMEVVPSLMSEKTMLVSFQNGLGNSETILKKIKPEQYLAGRVITGIETSPGKIKVTVTADPVAVGGLPGVKTLVRAFDIAQTLNSARIPCVPVPDILTVIWAKVIYNCALNGICTIEEIPYGKILDNERTRNQMTEVVRECYAVGLKKGITLSPKTADEFINLLVKRLIPSTATHTTSMLQDLRNGKRIEIDSLNGVICRLGAETGIPTPQNACIVEAVLAKKAVL